MHKSNWLLTTVLVIPIIFTDAFAALDYLKPTKTSPEQKITYAGFFTNPDYVDSTLGVGMNGVVADFIEVGGGVKGSFDITEATISENDSGFSCLQLQNKCLSLGITLESAVRLGHWVALGKWRAFTCIEVADTPRSIRIREIVEMDGLVDVGREEFVGCGHGYIHESLNSDDILEMMRYIDFGWRAFDILSCSKNTARKLNDKYKLEKEQPDTDTFGSWVNIDFDERYIVDVDYSSERFRIREGNIPKRFEWVRAEGKLPHLLSVCDAYKPDFSTDTDQSVEAQSLRLFYVAAIFRTWSRVNYTSLVDAINEHVGKFD